MRTGYWFDDETIAIIILLLNAWFATNMQRLVAKIIQNGAKFNTSSLKLICVFYIDLSASLTCTMYC